ncbi:MAG: DUF4215 domain-containing protein [bacterium]|nr:DUF4215 domain-containing protein [bacterium]
MRERGWILVGLLVLASATSMAAPKRLAIETLDGRIVAGDREFRSWGEYVKSDYFEQHAGRCGKPAPEPDFFAPAGSGGSFAGAGAPSDCTYTSTNPAARYAPTNGRFAVPVVVHVIQNTGGAGFVSEQTVRDQIDILNEDFLALAGSNGANGTDVELEFVLATTDPSGNPTDGITYSTNNTWYNDGGGFWDSLAWDTSRYLNIYTNTAGGSLGYVPDLPQGGIAGSNEDRVVVLWESFGRNGPIGPPFNQGRTTTHEVGHYFGLEHTFTGGCGNASACYTTGDFICDTNPQAFETDGCDGSSCGSPDPTDNYMDYSDDLCMERFTDEQARRMRCSLEHYRVDLFANGGQGECGNGVVEPGETCEPPGTSTCDASCQVIAVCGNGTVEPGEDCEPPSTTTCDASCRRIPLCGDGVVDPGETCDDGNTTPGDGCDALCRSEATGGACCDVTAAAGCAEDPSVESCVCQQDDYCCEVEWDDLCVEAVEDFGCGSCSGSPPGEVSGSLSSEPLRFDSASKLAWENAAASGSDSFNLYRGPLTDLGASQYGQCFASGLAGNTTDDTDTPPGGVTWIYLVTGRNAVGEGPLGLDSSGAARTPGGVCP